MKSCVAYRMALIGLLRLTLDDLEGHFCALYLLNSYISGNVARIKYDKHICLYMNRKAKVACNYGRPME